MPHLSLTKLRTCHTQNWTLTPHWTTTPPPPSVKCSLLNNQGKNHTTPNISEGKDMPHPSLTKQRTCHTQNWTLTPHSTTTVTAMTHPLWRKETLIINELKHSSLTKEKTTPHPPITNATPIINKGKDMPHPDPSLNNPPPWHTHYERRKNPLLATPIINEKPVIIYKGNNHATPIINEANTYLSHPLQPCHTHHEQRKHPLLATLIINEQHATPMETTTPHPLLTKEKTTPHPSLMKERTCHTHH